MDAKTISATEARNNFFTLIDESFFEGRRFIIKKGGRKWAEITPLQEKMKKQKQKEQLELLKHIDENREKMPKTTDSVKLIREMRLHGR